MSDDVLRQHTAQLGDLEVRVSGLAKDVQDMVRNAPDPTDPSRDASSVAPESHPSEFLFEVVDDWVRDFLVPTFQRPFGGELRWCSQWKEHPEAALRLEAMWRAWEALRVDAALGPSVWLLSHFDPSFTVLTGRAGPFARCTTDRHAA